MGLFSQLIQQGNPGYTAPSSGYDLSGYLDQLSGATPTADMSGDPWTDLMSAYGLGAAPAAGMPGVLPGVQLDAPPQLSTDPSRFMDYTNQINGQIGDAYGYDTPQTQAVLGDPSQVPQVANRPELEAMISGQGFSPEILAQMRATATEAPAQAGLQQMSQMKRMLGQNGIQGGAAAAMQGEVARNTGYQQGQALRDVNTQNAQAGMENARFGLSQANQLAMQNANMVLSQLQQNQQVQNSANTMNTQLQAQQKGAGAAAQSGFLGQQGAQWQDQSNQRDFENADKNWSQELQNTNYDWQKQMAPWQELNQRYGQAAGTLGSWGQ